MAKYNAKLTPEVSAKICEALSKGHTIDAACSYAKVSRQSFHNWYNRGTSARSGKYKQFACDVDDAQGQARYTVEKVILDNIPDNPKDAKWWLSKRTKEYRDTSYNETKLEADVNTEVTINLLTKIKQKRKELTDLDND